MASTRTNLTAAFVAGLVAVSGILAVTLWAVRNASVYRDIARYASTEADLATGVILEAGEGAQPVIIGPDTAAEALFITPRLGAMLNSFPGYLVVIDRNGLVLFQSDDVRRLNNADASVFSEQIANLPPGGPAGLLSLPNRKSLVPRARSENSSSVSLPPEPRISRART